LLKHQSVSTVITGATKPEQILQNLEVYEVLPKPTAKVDNSVVLMENNTGRLEVL
jgi:aryl-alcohol dehydrogenase-like predicted oxidoreductase